MYLSNESILVILLVGLCAGWLAGHVVRGSGFGLVGDMIVGVVGAFIGEALVPELGLHLGTGMLAAILNATIGAIPLVLVIRLFNRSGWGGGWSRRWGGRW